MSPSFFLWGLNRVGNLSWFTLYKGFPTRFHRDELLPQFSGRCVDVVALQLLRIIIGDNLECGFCHIKGRLLNLQHSLHSCFPRVKTTTSSCSFPRTYNKHNCLFRQENCHCVGCPWSKFKTIITLDWAKSLSAFTETLMQTVWLTALKLSPYLWWPIYLFVL